MLSAGPPHAMECPPPPRNAQTREPGSSEHYSLSFFAVRPSPSSRCACSAFICIDQTASSASVHVPYTCLQYSYTNLHHTPGKEHVLRTVLDGCADTLLGARPPVGRPLSPARAEDPALELAPPPPAAPGADGGGGGDGAAWSKLARPADIVEPRAVGVRVGSWKRRVVLRIRRSSSHQ